MINKEMIVELTLLGTRVRWGVEGLSGGHWLHLWTYREEQVGRGGRWALVKQTQNNTTLKMDGCRGSPLTWRPSSFCLLGDTILNALSPSPSAARRFSLIGPTIPSTTPTRTLWTRFLVVVWSISRVFF